MNNVVSCCHRDALIKFVETERFANKFLLNFGRRDHCHFENINCIMGSLYI